MEGSSKASTNDPEASLAAEKTAAEKMAQDLQRKLKETLGNFICDLNKAESSEEIKRILDLAASIFVPTKMEEMESIRAAAATRLTRLGARLGVSVALGETNTPQKVLPGSWLFPKKLNTNSGKNSSTDELPQWRR